MPIELKAAGEQLKRLVTLKQWRDLSIDEQRAYREQFAAIPKSEYHARQIIDRIISRETWLPAIAEFRQIADEVPSQPPLPGAGGCQRCEYSGRISDWYLITVDRHPSGRVKRINREILHNDLQDPYWLMHQPNILLGDNQDVALISHYCDCALGERLRAGAAQRRYEAA